MKTFFIFLGVMFALISTGFIANWIYVSNQAAIENDNRKKALEAAYEQKIQNLEREHDMAILTHQVINGMSAQDVERALGEPDSIDEAPKGISAQVKQMWNYGNNFVLFGWDNVVVSESDALNYNKEVPSNN